MQNENLAYWIGVVQSDGCFKTYFEKRRSSLRNLISFTIGRNSLPMLQKFQSLSRTLFNRNAQIFKANNIEKWYFQISVKELLGDFKKFDITFGDPPKPAVWLLSNHRYFGAYLAGLRITNSIEQTNLQQSISKILACKVSIAPRAQEKRLGERKFIGKSFELEFYVSKKNYQFIKSYVAPYITLDYKKNKLLQFIESKWPD